MIPIQSEIQLLNDENNRTNSNISLVQRHKQWMDTIPPADAKFFGINENK